MEKISRELLLAFWKVHALHHASQEPIYGQWIIEELRRHGYNVSPGTVYPMLARMARNGWLRADGSRSGTPTRRKPYSLTAKG
ncbi:helix-turn-helix transcriptional regulator, partial [Candidatus Sumerlaeota bacterium]|nr:helix-turn-helix transcriptional regulator [Candidatus Sumerlaeota bacterium]